jgi:hypothetical protein
LNAATSSGVAIDTAAAFLEIRLASQVST